MNTPRVWDGGKVIKPRCASKKNGAFKTEDFGGFEVRNQRCDGAHMWILPSMRWRVGSEAWTKYYSIE